MKGEPPYTPFDPDFGERCIVKIQVESAFTYLRYAGIVHNPIHTEGVEVDYEIRQGGRLAIHRGVFAPHCVERRTMKTWREGRS